MKMNIKNNMKAVWAVCACMAALPACTDMMDTDSTTVVFEEGNRMDSPNDSLYTVMGILSQVQRLGDRYVLYGELRGDLMEATGDADVDIQEISNFNVSAGNEYASFTDYYNVINNCNYAIVNMDTSIVIYEEKVMIPEYAAIKALRAWTYWQLGLAAGQVSWIEEPVLSLEAALQDYPQKNLEELADLLIDDLTPYLNARPLDYGTMDGFNSNKAFIPIDLLLGDLYLFMGRYADAAQMYYHYIDDHDLVLAANGNYWSSTTRTDYFSLNSGWVQTYSYATSSEMLSSLVYSTQFDAYHPEVLRWSYNETPFIVPADEFVDQMQRATHYHAIASASVIQGYFIGDLRGEAERAGGTLCPISFGTDGLGDYQGAYITKFYCLGASSNVWLTDPENEYLGLSPLVRNLPIYRTPHVYLRLAEAINRYGRPATAFAVLAYGLNSTTLSNSSRVPVWERTGETFLNFTSDTYSNNVGSASRGRGRGISYSGSDYTIPDYTPYDTIQVADAETGGMKDTVVVSDNAGRLAEALADSIEFVEDCIVDEMAAETSFEGNRFFDLMRIARHRGQWPAYAAGKVSARFGSGAEAMKARLQEENAWFMK